MVSGQRRQWGQHPIEAFRFIPSALLQVVQQILVVGHHYSEGCGSGSRMASLEGEPMTDHDIADVRPALSAYLRQYLGHFSQKPIATHFDNTGRGWLSHRPRKSVEPIALACGTAARTLLPRQVADVFSHMLSDILGALVFLMRPVASRKGPRPPAYSVNVLAVLVRSARLIMALLRCIWVLLTSLIKPYWMPNSISRCLGIGIENVVDRRVFPTPSSINPSGEWHETLTFGSIGMASISTGSPLMEVMVARCRSCQC